MESHFIASCKSSIKKVYINLAKSVAIGDKMCYIIMVKKVFLWTKLLLKVLERII